MGTLRQYYFEKVKSSPHLWKNKTGIERGINLFRENVINEFIKLNDMNLLESFDLFTRETGFWGVYTKEDFAFNFLHYYDFIGECNYFDAHPKELDNCYKNTIRDLWADGCYNLSFVKELLKEYNRCDTLHIDGVIDNILHAQEDFIDFLPSAKALKHYDINEMNLVCEKNTLEYLKEHDEYERSK
jgi:hypothetical protein